MVDDGLLGKIFSISTAAWTAVLMLAVRLFHTWPNIQARQNERKRDAAAEKAGDWDRLRDENKRLHAMLDKCETERLKALERAVKAEATLQGYGELRQLRAIADAAKRQGDGDA